MTIRVLFRGFSIFRLKLGLFLVIPLLLLLSTQFPAAGVNNFLPDIPDNITLNDFQVPKSGISQYDLSIPRVDDSNVIIDGSISDGEYGGSFTDFATVMTVYWEYDGENLSIGIDSPCTGWVSLGIGDKMEGSNMILGGVASGTTPYCYDFVGTTGWDHNEDTANGGTDDILEFDASENATNTLLEFRIPLDSGDSLDPVMQEGGIISIFLGYHATSDNIIDYHTAHSSILTAFLRPNIVIRATEIVLQVPSTVTLGSTFNVSASLEDENRTLLVNKTVVFFRKSIFGDVEIGSVNTSTDGEATFTYVSHELDGPHIFGAKFYELIVTEDSLVIAYTSSEDTEVIIFMAEEEQPTEPAVLIMFYSVQGIFWLSIGGIWIFYGFNVLVLIRNFFDQKSGKNEKQKRSFDGELWSEES